MLRTREAADGLRYGRVGPRCDMSGHLLSHSNSFGFEREKDAAGCCALNRNFIVGGVISLPDVTLKFDSCRKDELIQEARTLPVCTTSFKCEALAYPPTLEITAGGSHLRVLIDFNN